MEDAAVQQFKNLIKEGQSALLGALESENSFIDRGILYICQKQGSAIDDYITGTTPTQQQRVSGPSFDEVSVLFISLKKAFDGKDTICTIDDNELVIKLITGWSVLIRWWRSITSANQSPARLEYSTGCLNMVEIAKGNARRYHKIIDDRGKIMDINPHEIAYVSRKQEDIEHAFRLQPIRPDDLKIKFMNRDIVEKMGYTIMDAVNLCKAGNFGIVENLIADISFAHPSYQKIGYDLLNCLCDHNSIKSESIVFLLFKNKLSIFDLTSDYVSPEHRFFTVVRSMHDLEKLLMYVDARDCISKCDKIKRNLCWAASQRCTERGYVYDEFSSILDLWCDLHLESSQRLEDMPQNLVNMWKLEFCKEVASITCSSKDCHASILKLISDLEK